MNEFNLLIDMAKEKSWSQIKISSNGQAEAYLSNQSIWHEIQNLSEIYKHIVERYLNDSLQNNQTSKIEVNTAILKLTLDEETEVIHIEFEQEIPQNSEANITPDPVSEPTFDPRDIWSKSLVEDPSTFGDAPSTMIAGTPMGAEIFAEASPALTEVKGPSPIQKPSASSSADQQNDMQDMFQNNGLEGFVKEPPTPLQSQILQTPPDQLPSLKASAPPMTTPIATKPPIPAPIATKTPISAPIAAQPPLTPPLPKMTPPANPTDPPDASFTQQSSLTPPSSPAVGLSSPPPFGNRGPQGNGIPLQPKELTQNPDKTSHSNSSIIKLEKPHSLTNIMQLVKSRNLQELIISYCNQAYAFSWKENSWLKIETGPFTAEQWEQLNHDCRDRSKDLSSNFHIEVSDDEIRILRFSLPIEWVKSLSAPSILDSPLASGIHLLAAPSPKELMHLTASILYSWNSERNCPLAYFCDLIFESPVHFIRKISFANSPSDNLVKFNEPYILINFQENPSSALHLANCFSRLNKVVFLAVCGGSITNAFTQVQSLFNLYHQKQPIADMVRSITWSITHQDHQGLPTLWNCALPIDQEISSSLAANDFDLFKKIQDHRQIGDFKIRVKVNELLDSKEIDLQKAAFILNP